MINLNQEEYKDDNRQRKARKPNQKLGNEDDRILQGATEKVRERGSAEALCCL